MHCRARDAVAKEKAQATEAKGQEEEMQIAAVKLQKQVEKATAERNAAEGRSQRSAAALLKIKADLASLEIKFQVDFLSCTCVRASLEAMWMSARHHCNRRGIVHVQEMQGLVLALCAYSSSIGI